MQDQIFSDLNTFSKSIAECTYSVLKLLFELRHAYTFKICKSFKSQCCCLFVQIYAGMRVAASSSASALLAFISASVRPNRVHSSLRGTAICC